MNQPTDGLANFTFTENCPPSLAEYTALRDSVGWPLTAQEKSGEFLKNCDYSVTVRDNKSKELVGFGSVRFPKHYFDFYDLITNPSCQRRGIGKKVCSMVIAWCQSRVNEQSEEWMKLLGKVARNMNSFYEPFGFVNTNQAGGSNEMSLTLRKKVKTEEKAR